MIQHQIEPQEAGDLLVMQAVEELEESLRTPEAVYNHIRAALDKLYAYFDTSIEEELGADYGRGPILAYPDGQLLQPLD